MADNYGYTELVGSLRKSFREGKMKSYEARIKLLKQLHLMLQENEQEIYDALHQDLHKCKVEANLMEVLQVRIPIGEAIGQLHNWMKPEKKSGDLLNRMNTCEIRKDPLGVVLVIGAWNYPVQLCLLPIVGAIAAGNCVILKPSEVSPTIAGVLEKLIHKYLDKDCIHVVNGGIPETTALLKQRFDHILYTGSANVGKIVMTAAAKHLTPVTLELGGKCPAIVDKTCDFSTITQRIVWGKFCNAGQTCLAVDYILCPKDCQQDLVESLTSAIKKFYGENPQKSDSYGRIVNKRHFERVCKLINSSKVVYGNVTDADDLYISPTIMTNITADDTVMGEEIFGPLLPIVTVDSIDEAIEFVNEREKALALYVFSNDYKTTEKVANSTSSGGMCVNDALVHASVPSLPFGGVGESGMGAYHGQKNFDTFTHHKSYMWKNQQLEGANSIRYPPYDENWSVLKWLEWLITPTVKH